MKKIHYVVWRAELGGLEIVTRRLIENFRNDYDISLYSIRPVQRRDTVFKNQDQIIIFGPGNKIGGYLSIFSYFLKNRSNGIFHLMNTGPIVLLLARLAGVEKLIYHIHGTVYDNSMLQRVFGKILWSLAVTVKTKVVANSGYSKAVFMNRATRKVVPEVIYNPLQVDTGETVPEEPKKENSLEIFYIGRLSREKNLFEWLDIASEIYGRHPDSSFHIYGTGPLLEDLKEYSKARGISDRIFFEGYLEVTSMAYKRHDLLLFVSKFESFGNVAVESILYGTPVLVSPIPSMKEIFSEYPGFLLQERCPLKDSVLLKLENYQELKSLSLDAMDEFRKNFSEESCFKRMSELYNEFPG